jgi:hypothetical protein
MTQIDKKGIQPKVVGIVLDKILQMTQKVKRIVLEAF